MIKKIIFLFILFSNVAVGADFRAFNWGTTLNEIKSKEKAKLIKYNKNMNGGDLHYQSSLVDEPVNIIYRFTPYCAQLATAEYVFHSILSRSKYELLVSSFFEKYGKEMSKEHTDNLWETKTTYINLHRKTIYVENNPDFLSGNTQISYHNKDYNFMLGWAKGKEPRCKEKEMLLKKTKDNI